MGNTGLLGAPHATGVKRRSRIEDSNFFLFFGMLDVTKKYKETINYA
jgi:hypothetical protein